jgi:hypothetical protein
VLRSWNRIILVDPEPHRDAVPALTAPAPNLMFNNAGFSKMSQCISCLLFLFNFRRNHKNKIDLLNFVCLRKLALYIYRRSRSRSLNRLNKIRLCNTDEMILISKYIRKYLFLKLYIKFLS